MKKLRLFMFLTLITILTLLALSGCKNEDSVESISFKDHDPTSAIEIEVGNFDYNAYTVVVVYESGSTEEIALTEEMISEEDLFKLYQVGEHDIAINYGNKQYSFKVSVKRNSFKDLRFPENNVFVYNGEPHTVEVDGEIPANATVTYIGGNSFVNAGMYDVTAVVACEGYVTQKLTTTVTIEKAKYDMSGVKFEGREVVYDGTYHSVTISGKLPDGVSAPTYKINGKPGSSAIDTGVYTVKATFENNDPNYEAIPDMEAILKITPAEYTVKGVDIVFKSESGSVINSSTKIYDGTSVAFDLSDYSKLSKKITVSFVVYDKDGKVISTSNKKTNIQDAGVYTARVEFTMVDGHNYKPIPPLERTFEVLKAKYPSLDNVEFSPSQSQYDGRPHSILIEGQLPEGVTVSYEYYKDDELLVDSEGNPIQSVVDVGRYLVKAIFTHTDTNRDEIEPLSVILNITAASFNISNLELELNGTNVYDGTQKTVRVIGHVPDEITAVAIYYHNGQIVKNQDGSYATSVLEPGDYYVYVQFTSSSGNYLISGMLEYTFTISKGIINPADVEPDSSLIYTYSGDNQSPSIKQGTCPLNVTIREQLFSIDSNGNRTATESSVNVGKYVKVITLTLDDPTRYQIKNSGVIEWAFEIVPQSIDPSVINIGDGKLIYNGTDLTPALKDVPQLVEYNSTLYTLEGTEPITEAINVGKYRLEVELSIDNPNYTLISDFVTLEFEITHIVINLDNILIKNTEYNYTENDLRFRVFEDQCPDVRGYINYSIAYIFVNIDGEWVEHYNVISRGYYRVVYYISIKPEYQSHVRLMFNGSELISVNPYYDFYIV